MRRFITVIVILLGWNSLTAQPELLDKVVSVVGENIILKSDVDIQYEQYRLQEGVTEEFKCYILDQLISEKVLLDKARADSIVVSDEEIEGELDRRMRYFVSLLGSVEKFESYYGRTVEEYKNEFRADIKHQMTAQRVRNKIIGSVTISPKEVQEYFYAIPEDSLPFFNASVEFEQIVLYAKVGKSEEDVARTRLERIRKDIVENGKDFAFMAELYSEDPGSATSGGDLGCFGKNQMVPEFESVAFQADTGEVSEVFQTQFGFHIMQVYKKEGETVCARHILIRTTPSNATIEKLATRLDSIRSAVVAGNISFTDAIGKYSDETNPDVVNPQTNSTVLDMSILGQIDPNLGLLASSMKVNDISQPIAYQSLTGQVGYRIVRLKAQTKPHVANLNDDYQRIMDAALNLKKEVEYEKWLMSYKDKTYIHITDDYKSCGEVYRRWVKTN